MFVCLRDAAFGAQTFLRDDDGMMERRQIVELWHATGDRPAVLVTLVRAEGSSYRRPGARLLAAEQALHAGTLSGGCLEAEVLKKAPWMVRDGARVERYSMMFDDTAEIPFGLGCGGTVELLFEPADAPEGRALLEALEGSLAGREATVVSFLPGGGRTLRRLIVDGDGAVVFKSAALSDDKIACAQRLTPGEVYEGRFVERLRAPQRLFVLGAGDDARPLVELATQVGFAVTVADGRPQLARRERFARAERVVALGEDLARGCERLGISSADAVVLMTHSYEQDRALLVATLPLAPRYLGLLGARHRSSLLVSEAAAMLGRSVADCCERLFAPVGMDLGGDGPEAIALAIVAEVHGVVHGRLGSSLRLSAEDVAEQVRKGGASRYLQAQCALEAEV
jgi:xanthine/CO dehydrogenase XdhC/CoxF family maturation factor